MPLMLRVSAFIRRFLFSTAPLGVGQPFAEPELITPRHLFITDLVHNRSDYVGSTAAQCHRVKWIGHEPERVRRFALVQEPEFQAVGPGITIHFYPAVMLAPVRMANDIGDGLVD